MIKLSMSCFWASPFDVLHHNITVPMYDFYSNFECPHLNLLYHNTTDPPLPPHRTPAEIFVEGGGPSIKKAPT